ncbi:uncharacterized protein LOC124305581 [Neodiprion virginianus]|uniref:uncharacterized protein LOC124305581 n=1 Tax=Neodiprion virginianus TaxID=2961670 RepID=UPI001EE74AF4|nr:uncharacterized protein LOC124305581 [Neodiprion virginianus]
MNIRSIRETISLLIKANIQKEKFFIRATDTNDATVRTDTINTHTQVTTALKAAKVEYFTYTPKSLRPKPIVLKEIAGDYNKDDILEELKELNLPNTKIDRVTQLKTNNENQQRKIYIVHLTHDSELTHIKNIKFLAHQKIRWEHLKRSAIHQCSNCQRLGHASINWHMPYRCVKRSDNHAPGECTITTETDKQKLRCANCSSTGHPSSYKGCPYYKFIIKIIRANNTTNQKQTAQKLHTAHRTIKQGLSFAQATSNKTTQQIPHTTQ